MVEGVNGKIDTSNEKAKEDTLRHGNANAKANENFFSACMRQRLPDEPCLQGVSTRCRIEKREDNGERTQTRRHPMDLPD